MMQLFTEADLENGVDLHLPKPTTRGATRPAGSNEVRVRAGLPLHVSWTTFYTGEIANRRRLIGRSDENRPILLTSAIKPSANAAAAQRAFLAMWDESEDRDYLFPEATAAGASVLYYSGDIQRGLTLTIDLFEKYKKTKVLSQIGAALGSAAAFPPLAFASGFLLIGSTVTKVADELVDKLSKDRQRFSSSQQIYASSDYPALTEPRYAFLSADQIAMEEALQFRLSDGGRPYLVRKATGERYVGDNPYVICRYVQDRVDGLADYDLRAEALALLEGWSPRKGAEVGELLGVLSEGVRVVRDA